MLSWIFNNNLSLIKLALSREITRLELMKLWTTKRSSRLNSENQESILFHIFSYFPVKYTRIAWIWSLKFKIIWDILWKGLGYFLYFCKFVYDCTWWLQGIEGSFVFHFISGHESVDCSTLHHLAFVSFTHESQQFKTFSVLDSQFWIVVKS